MIDEQFWGETISIYTDADAQDDGILTDVCNLGVEFNGKVINRLTASAALAVGLKDKQPAAAKNNLEFVASHSTFDGAGADAWGIFEANPKLGNEKFWLVPNEVGGYTLMLPDEY